MNVTSSFRFEILFSCVIKVIAEKAAYPGGLRKARKPSRAHIHLFPFTLNLLPNDIQ